MVVSDGWPVYCVARGVSAAPGMMCFLLGGVLIDQRICCTSCGSARLMTTYGTSLRACLSAAAQPRCLCACNSCSAQSSSVVLLGVWRLWTPIGGTSWDPDRTWCATPAPTRGLCSSNGVPNLPAARGWVASHGRLGAYEEALGTTLAALVLAGLWVMACMVVPTDVLDFYHCTYSGVTQA